MSRFGWRWSFGATRPGTLGAPTAAPHPGGVPLPEGMWEHDAFPEPIITLATKAEEGHDEDISEAEILQQGIVSEELYRDMERVTRALFARGQEMAAERGLILVDTKYEFGLHDGKLMLADEVHTPDSSRYFHADGFEERQAAGALKPSSARSSCGSG